MGKLSVDLLLKTHPIAVDHPCLNFSEKCYKTLFGGIFSFWHNELGLNFGRNVELSQTLGVRGCIFSRVRPLYEHAVSNLDP